MLAFFIISPHFLSFISNLESIIRSHGNNTFLFSAWPYSAINPNITFSLLKLVVKFLFQSKHFCVLSFVLIQQFIKSLNLFLLPLNFILQPFYLLLFSLQYRFRRPEIIFLFLVLRPNFFKLLTTLLIFLFFLNSVKSVLLQNLHFWSQVFQKTFF